MNSSRNVKADQHSRSMASRPTFGQFRRNLIGLNNYGVVLVLVVLILAIGAFHRSFFSVPSMENIVESGSVYGFMALGEVFLLSMREIDLSVGAIYGLSVNVAAILIGFGWNPWLAALAAIVVGALLGAINGILTNLIRVESIIVTLGTMSAFLGVTLLITHGNSTVVTPGHHSFYAVVGGNVGGIPFSILCFAVCTVLLGVIYRRTRYGFNVRAAGSNPDAARLSGLSIPRLRLISLMLAGGLSAMSGILTLAAEQGTDPNMGSGFELFAIAAAIIGGTALAGGSGSVVGALFGSLLISVISAGLIQMGASGSWSIFATGAIIIGAVAVDRYLRTRAKATANSIRERGHA